MFLADKVRQPPNYVGYGDESQLIDNGDNYFYCNHMNAHLVEEDGCLLIKTGFRGCNDGEIPVDALRTLDEIDDMIICLRAIKERLKTLPPKQPTINESGEDLK